MRGGPGPSRRGCSTRLGCAAGMRAQDVQQLLALGLLRPPGPLAAEGASLLALCAAGALEGGLSVASDVRPADLVGPLCSYLGGKAARLRILDARTEPAELWVRLDAREERWPTPDIAALVTHLNRGYRHQAEVPAVARLGIWESDFQLWCIPKRLLSSVLRKGFLQAENLAEVSALQVDGRR